MSSVFLYVAIVGIWAFILVPRWLRRAHSGSSVEIDVEIDYDAGEQAEDGWQPQPGDDDEVDTEPFGAIREAHRRRRLAQAEAAATRPAGVSSRSRVLRARRRLLTLLVALAIAAVACTALKLTSWWACIPPAVMLGMYLLLLREAALADAEHARRRAAFDVQAVRQRAPEPVWVPEEEPSAQIIDISARVSDQLYDQYADATVRAVGD